MGGGGGGGGDEEGSYLWLAARLPHQEVVFRMMQGAAARVKPVHCERKYKSGAEERGENTRALREW